MTLGGNLSTSSTFCCLVVTVLASNLTTGKAMALLLPGIPTITHQAEQSESGIGSPGVSTGQLPQRNV